MKKKTNFTPSYKWAIRNKLFNKLSIQFGVIIFIRLQLLSRKSLICRFNLFEPSQTSKWIKRDICITGAKLNLPIVIPKRWTQCTQSLMCVPMLRTVEAHTLHSTSKKKGCYLSASLFHPHIIIHRNSSLELPNNYISIGKT